MRSVDWGRSSVGAFETWPQSLKTALSICLGSQFPMFVWWGKDLTVFYNDAYIPLTGLKHPHYLGRPAREQWAEIWDALRPLTEQVLRTGRSTWAESMLLFMTRKGFLEETYFTFSYSPIRDESGAVGGIINPCQETTQLVLGQRRLKTLHDLAAHEKKSLLEVGEASAQTLGDNVYDIPFASIYLTQADGTTATLIGASGIVAGTKAFPKILDGSSESRDVWKIGSVGRTHTPERVNGLRSLFPEDLPRLPYEETPDSAYVLPVTLPNQETPSGFLILGISPRLEFDERYQEFFGLVRRQISVHIANIHALEDEKKRTEALAEIDRSKTAFFSNVSHEFRTPLTLMLGPLEEILSDGKKHLDPSLRIEIEIVHRNALRLLKLVNHLLDFSRIEANRAQACYEPLDLASYTSYLASAFETAAKRAGMKLTVQCPPLPEPVYADKDMWEKIVLNLLSNAFKYTVKGKIEVSLHPADGAVELQVRDTGVGIPQEEIPKLFQRFHRVQGTQSRTHEGTGIGLALVKELVELHGGGIRVESLLSQGSTFTVKIPIGTAHLPQDRIAKVPEVSPEGSKVKSIHAEAFVEETLCWLPSPSPSVPVKSQNDLLKKRIVLADDNADMRNYVSRLLSERYEVISVANGREALQTIGAERPDLVLSDVMMPVMDGIELLQKIRTDPALQTLPVILLSARAGDEAQADGIGLGADDYLTKPFSALELQARVQTQLSLAEMRTRLVSELEVANREFMHAKQETEAINRELEAFSYSVAHDLRAPLRSIDGFSKIILEDCGEKMDAEGKMHLGRICEAVQLMSQLIDDMLTLARVAQSDFTRMKVDLSALVRGAWLRLERADAKHRPEMVIQEGLQGEGDSRLLAIVFDNLLGNARKFTRKRDRARIEFGATVKDGQSVYFVRDNGAGFDMAYADKLFGVFQRLHSAQDFEGTGVGLATVQRIIHRHGGRIWAEGKVDAGATFYFTLAGSGIN